jgi:hypothetical protein
VARLVGFAQQADDLVLKCEKVEKWDICQAKRIQRMNLKTW